MEIWPPNKCKCSQDHNAQFRYFKKRILAPKTFTQEMAEKSRCKICSHLQQTTIKHTPRQISWQEWSTTTFHIYVCYPSYLQMENSEVPTFIGPNIPKVKPFSVFIWKWILGKYWSLIKATLTGSRIDYSLCFLLGILVFLRPSRHTP